MTTINSNQATGNSDFLSLAISKKVVSGAIKVAIVVGTILAAINHGDKIVSMSVSDQDMIKILFTYFVPYCVSTWSAVMAIKASSVQSD